MKFKEFPIGKDDIDRRIDRVVRKFLQDTPLTIIYKNIRSGFIRVNNKKVKNEYRMQEHDVLFLEENFFNNSKIERKDYMFSNKTPFYETIFKNDDILIINKPVGVNVQSVTKDDISLDKIIKSDFIASNKSKESLSFMPGPLHRLDKNTSGLLAFSQSLHGARVLTEAFQNHSIKKTYICILKGKLETKLDLEHSLQKKSVKKGFVTVEVSDSGTGTLAKTRVYPIEYGMYKNESITFAKVIIETGRTHQIRSQCSTVGFPLLGDTAYGYTGSAKDFFLHAYRLDFNIECNLEIPDFLIAKLPKSFSDFLENYLQSLDFNHII